MMALKLNYGDFQVGNINSSYSSFRELAPVTGVVVSPFQKDETIRRAALRIRKYYPLSAEQ